jgi:thiol-disulfide isomerase/thioredoxin
MTWSFARTAIVVLGSLGTSLTFPARIWADEPVDAWQTDFDAAVREAQASRRPILAAVTAVWCGPCRQMKELTLNDPEVARLLAENFVTLMIDGDRHPDVIARLGVAAYPTTLLLNSDGGVAQRWVGFQSAESFRSELRQALRSGGGAGPQVDEFPAVSALYPTNASPFEFGGFCLVSLLDDNKLRRGVETYHAEHRGVRICFYSAEHRDKFLRNPDRYWPVANGNCLVTDEEDRRQLPGDPRVGVLWQNRLWFFTDRERQQRFIRSPHRFSRGM